MRPRTTYAGTPAQNKKKHDEKLSQLSKEMKDYLTVIPDAEELQPDRSRERMTPDKVAVVLKCLVRDDAPKKLELSYVSGVLGETGHEYILADTDGYKLAFFVRGGQLTNCWRCVTPKGKEYNVAVDSGQPVCNYLEHKDWLALDKLVRSFNGETEVRKIGVREFYQVVIDMDTDRENSMGPMYDKGPTSQGKEFPRELMKMHARFYSRADAQAVAESAEKYLEIKNRELSKSKKRK